MTRRIDLRLAALAAGIPLSLLLCLVFFLPWVSCRDAAFREVREWRHATGLDLAIGRKDAPFRVRPDVPRPLREDHAEVCGAIDEATPARPWFLLAFLLPVAAVGIAAAGLSGRMGAGPAGRALMLAAAVGLVLVAMAVHVDCAPARLAAFDTAFDQEYAALETVLDEQIERMLASYAATRPSSAGTQPATLPAGSRAMLEGDKRKRLAAFVERGAAARERVYEGVRTSAAPSLWMAMGGFGLLMLCGIVSGATARSGAARR